MVNVTLQRVDLKDVKHYLFIITKERKKSYFFLGYKEDGMVDVRR
jgi:hypothetical protein